MMVRKPLARERLLRNIAMKSERTAETGGVESDLIELEEAVRILKTSRSTLYRWVREGRIPAQKAGRQWRFERAEIDRFLRGEGPRIELRTDISPLLKALEGHLRELGAEPPAQESDPEVLYAVRLILDLGLAVGASDIHVAPNLGEDGRADRVAVRYRIDGVLHPMLDFDSRLLAPLVAQWKVLFACNPSETAKPQDGLFKFERGGEAQTARAHFLPAFLGPTVTVRLLQSAGLLRSVDGLGLAEGDLETLREALGHASGLIVVDGPAGSGTTTTVYACLKELAGPSRKIMTVEDPVEVVLPWTVQTQVREAEGFTVAKAAVSLLRSDPDVLFLCELPDPESAQIAATSAAEGQLVFTTTAAGQATRALKRLMELGVPPAVVGRATKRVVSQRLARALCPDCSEPAELSAEERAQAERMAQTGRLSLAELPSNWRRPVGCPKCKGIGYRGRTILAEVLEMTPEIADALQQGAPTEVRRGLAVEQGMTPLATDGVRRAAAGQTTVEEVARVLSAHP
jgi:excisionase family DNA binding protein